MVECLKCGKTKEGSKDDLIKEGWEGVKYGERDYVWWCPEHATTENIMQYFTNVDIAEEL